jgi:hypothetical protein
MSEIDEPAETESVVVSFTSLKMLMDELGDLRAQRDQLQTRMTELLLENRPLRGA